MKSPNKSKVNALKPSMREKKRYMAYEIISDKPLLNNISKQLVDKLNSLLGVFQSAEAGIISVKYNPENQRGVLRVDRKFTDHMRACFVMIKELGSQEVLIRTLNVSGMVNKASKYIEK